ncbi:MAG: hypothetical protein SFX73_38280 [Kofleriaceae bacterium]|nr:hypothetical protein [Kofleriaceae bacterium]
MSEWKKSWAVAVVVAATALFGYERYCRHFGFEPSVEETANAWIDHWNDAIPGRAVLLGNSRCQAALRPEGLAAMFGGEPPVQLCTVGVSPLSVLDYLVNHTSFSGTAIVEIVPGVVFVRVTDKWPDLKRHLEEGPVFERFETKVLLALQSRLAMLNRQAKPLVRLRGLRGLNPEWLQHQTHAVRRDGVHILVGHPELTRQDFAPEKWPDGLPWPQYIKADYEKRSSDEELDQLYGSWRRTIEKLEERGGQVIFVRLPVTGTTREAEDKYFPREKYWDQLIRKTGAPGVYYADHAELQGFEQPDESHVAKWESQEFTRRLAAILKPVLRANSAPR